MPDSSNRPEYSFVQQGVATAFGSSSGGGSIGRHIIKPGCGVEYWSPSWDGECIIRILPAFNGSQELPFRYSARPHHYSDWLRSYECVRLFGVENPITMLLHDSCDPTYDPITSNPCWILFRAIDQAIKNGRALPEWPPLTIGGVGRGAQLSKPTKMYFVQCLMFRHNGKDYFGDGQLPRGFGPDDDMIVMGLPASAGDELVRQIEDRDIDWKGDPNDLRQFKCSDPVGINAGKFVHIFNREKDPRAGQQASNQAQPTSLASMMQQSQRSGAQLGGAGRGRGRRDDGPKGYNIFLTDTLSGNPGDFPAALTGTEPILSRKVKKFDDFLNFYTDEEQAHIIANLFPPSAILFAFRDRPNWIPASVRDRGNFDTRQPVSSAPAPVAPWMQQPTQPVVAAPQQMPAPVSQQAAAAVPPAGTGSSLADMYNSMTARGQTPAPTQQAPVQPAPQPVTPATQAAPPPDVDLDKVAAARARLAAASAATQPPANQS